MEESGAMVGLKDYGSGDPELQGEEEEEDGEEAEALGRVT